MTDRDTTPSCPSCGEAMVLRTNRRDGSSFWGCRKYPACTGTRDIGEDLPDSRVEDGNESATLLRVLWNDATLERTGWQCRYTTAGGRLRSSPSLSGVASEFRQCWVARSSTTFVAPETVRRVTGALRKLIQRGSNPPIHPHAELELLKSLGLGGTIQRSPLPGDISVRLEPDVFQDVSAGGLSLPDPDFDRDEEVRLESGHERRFIAEWVPQNLGPGAPRWFIPQASFDALTASLADYSPSGQRVDFLINAPFGNPFVVEIDGPQHEDTTSPDGERDRLLNKIRIPVVRIPTAEIDQGQGANLERVRSLWTGPQVAMDKSILDAILVPLSIHRLVIALLDAVDAGFLRGATWMVEVVGEPSVDPSLIWPYVRLFSAMDRLWGPSMMPEEILLKTTGGWTRFTPRTDAPPLACEPQETDAHLVIRLEPYFTAVDKLERSSGNTPEIVVRSARLPVVVGDDLFEPAARANLAVMDPQDKESGADGSPSSRVREGELSGGSA